MNPIKELARAFEIISLTIAGAAATAIYSLLLATPLNRGIAFFLSVLAVPLASEGLSRLIKAAFDYFEFLRRFFLRGKFIEGTWIEIVKQGGQIPSIGIVWIEADGYSLKIHGFDYDQKGTINYDFESKPDLVKIEWPVVQFAYSLNSHGSQQNVEGMTILQFSHRRFRRPLTYAGSFIHIGSGERVGFEGWLLEDKEDLDALHDPAKLRIVLKKWIAKKGLTSVEVAERLPTLL